jgi:hypothetical protein
MTCIVGSDTGEEQKIEGRECRNEETRTTERKGMKGSEEIEGKEEIEGTEEIEGKRMDESFLVFLY